MLLVEGIGEHGGVAANEPGAGAGGHRADGVALVRHRGGAALIAPLAHLSDLGLREQEHIEADLGENAGCDRESGAELGDANAVRVPGNGCLRQAELVGVKPRNLGPGVAERSERARRPAELSSEACRLELRESPASVEHGDEPACGLEPEGRRHGLLEQRAGRHRRVPVRRGRASRTTSATPREIGEDQPERAAGDEHRGGVHHVLARRTQVHEGTCFLADTGDEGTHERLDRIADLPTVAQKLRPVVPRRRARLFDRARRIVRDDTGASAGAGERALGFEQRG